MPPEALSIALAASIYPPAVAAVIALGRGTDVRLRVLLFVIAALLTVYVTGVLILLVFSGVAESGGTKHTIGGGLSIALGVAALGLAWWLRRPRESKKKKEKTGPSKTERYLQNRRLVLVLGFTLYVVPSPVYLGAVKAVADSNASTTNQLVYLAIVVLVMLWMIEVPMLMLIVAPERGSALLERINAWFGRHGRTVAIVAAAGAGVYLIAAGVADLLK